MEITTKQNYFRYALSGLAILAITAITIVSIVRDRIISPMYNSISVNARGTIAYTPDTAIFNVGYTSDPSDEKSSSDITKVTAQIESVLKKIDNEITIQMSSLTATPSSSYDYGYTEESTSDTMTISAQFTIKVPHIDTDPQRITTVIAELNKIKVNQINSITYSSSKFSEIKQQAWEQAFANITKERDHISKTTHKKLKELMNLSENIISTGDSSSYSGLTPNEYVIELYATYRY